MASKRKVRVQKFRLSRKRKKQEQEKALRKEVSEKKQRQRSFRKEIKESLGFDKILSNLKSKFISDNPCKEIPLSGFGPNGRVLDWNGVEM